jgi:hypothetical protein
VREARPGLATLVDQCEHVARLVPCTSLPGLGYEVVGVPDLCMESHFEYGTRVGYCEPFGAL